MREKARPAALDMGSRRQENHLVLMRRDRDGEALELLAVLTAPLIRGIPDPAPRAPSPVGHRWRRQTGPGFRGASGQCRTSEGSLHALRQAAGGVSPCLWGSDLSSSSLQNLKSRLF